MMLCSVTPKHIQQIPQTMYVGSKGMAYTKRSRNVPLRTIVLCVLLCFSSCLLSVSLSYKWHMDTNDKIDQLAGTIEEAVQGLNAFSDIIRYELVTKHVNSNIDKEEHEGKNILLNYDDVEEDYGADRFMGKQLLGNWPAINHQVNESHESNNQNRRSAEVDAINILNNKLKNFLKENSNIEFIRDGNHQDERILKSFSPQKEKILESLRKTKIKEQENEDFKAELGTVVAAHFTFDSPKHSTAQTHYYGNRRLKHSNGDFQKWTPHPRNLTVSDSNSLVVKNDKVVVSKAGFYYVYAQIVHSNEHDVNGHYIIMKNDEKVLDCSTTNGSHSDSCYTGGLIYLGPNDSLSISGSNSEQHIVLDPTMSFFGLFLV